MFPPMAMKWKIAKANDTNTEQMDKNLLNTKQILVVDDESLIREVYTNFLASWGATVSEAQNGVEALSLIQSQSFDYILCDIRMPKLRGDKLLEKVNALSNLSSKPLFVFITGHEDVTFESVKSMGALGLFSKPLRKRDLYSFFDGLINASERESQKSA